MSDGCPLRTESSLSRLICDGGRVAGRPTLWEMTGKDLDAASDARQEPQAEVREIPDVLSTLSVPPISMDIYQFPVVEAAQ